MARCWLILFGPFWLFCPLTVDAQFFHGYLVFQRSPQPFIFNPVPVYSGYVGPAYVPYHTDFPNRYLAYESTEVVSIGIPDTPATVPCDPPKAPVVPSSAKARMKSLEHQMRGDQRLREQKWADAWAAYRSSADAAPDRAEAHLRLGMCLVAMQRYEPAIRELKRALLLDPTIPKVDKFSATLFGPDSKIVRSSIISKLSDWVREDYRDSDRLFVLGVALYFEGDPRGREVLEAALRMNKKGDASHISSFLGPPAAAVRGPIDEPNQELPKLNDKPIPMPFGQPFVKLPNPNGPIPGAPVPMPDL